MSRKLSIPTLICLVFIVGLGDAVAQTFDISSGGAPTITGASGGSVTGSANVLNNLLVTITFGELSPANTSGVVKVVVPIAIRSSGGGNTGSYRVRVTYTGSTNANPQAIQRTDFGFGVNNFRAMGANSRVCTNSNHIFTALFNNDPSSTLATNAAGRRTYLSTLNNTTTDTTILTGPRLSVGAATPRQVNNGYIFDAIFAITPQFYAAGVTTATLTFNISAGTQVPC